MSKTTLASPATKTTVTRPAENPNQQISSALDGSDYRRGYELLSQKILSGGATPSDQILAGVLALQLEKEESACAHFTAALAIQPENSDALYNLALMAMANQDPNSAIKYFEHIRHNEPSNASIYNDLGVAYLEAGRLARALTMLRHALVLDPNFRAARNTAMEICLANNWHNTAQSILSVSPTDTCTSVTIAEISRWRQVVGDSAGPTSLLTRGSSLRGKKIAIFASHDAFIKDIAADLANDNQVRKFDGESLERLQDLLRWADIAWFEWCDQLLIAATTLPKSCTIVCRLHSYEAFTEMPGQVDWSKVDQVVFVNQSVRELVGPRIPSTVPTTIIYNGVDLGRFALPTDKPTTKKIGSVGYINYKKNPALLLYAFEKIYRHDSSYTLHIAGQHQDPRIELYMNNYLRRHPLPVSFDGWVNDMPAWYHDKQFVISTSLFESFHYSIAEGMACGCLPLVHDWYGADYLYPHKSLFGDPDSCFKLVKAYESADLAKVRKENRQFIAERYDQSTKVFEIRALLASLAEKSQAVSLPTL